MKRIFIVMLITFLSLYLKSQCEFGNFPPSYTLNPFWTNGAWLAQKYTLANTATLTGLGLNAGANASTTGFRMAIYTDASNAPGNLVAASVQGVIVPGHNVLSLSSYTIIPAGNYWITTIYSGTGPATASSGGTAIRMQIGTLSTPPANSSAWTIASSYLVDYWAEINSPSITVLGSSLACMGSTVTLSSFGATSYTWNTGTTTYTLATSPTINTVYTVSGTGANGCIGTASHSLTSHALPTISISGSSSVCAGSSLTHTVSGALTYTWNTGANTSTIFSNPASYTVYSVIGSDAAGCTGSNYVVVNVNPLPNLVITGNTAVCAGSILSQTVSGAYTYTWNTGATTDTVLLAPSSNTVYSVSGADAAGCTSNTSIAVTLNPLPVLSVTGDNTVCAGSALSQTVSGASTYTWNTGATTNTVLLSPSSNTVYSVSGSDAAGCTSSTSIAITANPLPILSIAGNTVICAGSAFSQTVSGASTYTWNTGANTSTLVLSPASNTVYSVSGTNPNGCVATLSESITVNALPNLAVTSSNQNLCLGETVTLTVSGVSSCTWNAGATGTTFTDNPVVSVTYTLNGSDANGCMNSTTVLQNVSLCTGIEKSKPNVLDVKIFPNPSSGIFEISTELISYPVIIEIFNSTGSLVRKEAMESLNHFIDLSSEANGLYYILVRSKSEQRIIKLIKE